jgi:pimeloyl-ACP methyl ester carboxylesterase
MNGSKAQWLADYAHTHKRTFMRFDYFAHGQSDGDFMDFTIGRAVMDTCFMMDEFITRPAIIIGSSMGGWVAMRLMQIMADKIYGFIGIAAAPDFTRKLYAQLDDGHLAQLNDNGYVEEPNDYDEPYIFTNMLFDDGDRQCVLDNKFDFSGKVHLIQGKQDTSVDWHVPDAINACFDNRATITLINDADHSLSRPQDLDILQDIILDF